MDTNNQYDVVIVGAGMAGSVIAKQMALAGKKVLILEAGVEADDNAREENMQNFYLAMAKTPESPYPQNYNAPRPSVLDLKQIPADGGNAPDDCSNPVKAIDKNGYFIQKGPLPFASTNERRAGGTMWHWLGTSLRLAPNDFKMQSVYKVGVDWPMSYQDLSPYYDKAEFEIGVSADVEEQKILGITFSPDYLYPMQKIPPTVLDQAFSAKLDGVDFEGNTMQVTGTPAGRNSISNIINGEPYNNGRRLCQGNTNCTPICPIQAKYDATITLNDALDTGNVTVLYKTVAYNILMDGTSKAITGIQYKQYDTIQGPVTGTGTAVGAKYVLAAHAIENAKLLLLSNSQLPDGLANRSKQVGKNLMDHPVKLSWGTMQERVSPFRGPLTTSGIETLRDGTFRETRAAFRIEIGNEGWNWPIGDPYTTLNDMVNNGVFGRNLVTQLNTHFTRQFRIGFLVEQLGEDSNYIVPSTTCSDNLGIPRPEIHYNLSEYTKAGFEAADRATKLMFDKLGATEAFLTPEDLKSRPGYFEYNGKSYYFEGAGHIMGTHRMGFTPDDSVTDSNMKCWDHDNLYLVGCGSFPTTSTPNPTLTLVALAFKAADALMT